MRKKLSDIVEVTWRDASSGEMSGIENFNPEQINETFIMARSYGRLVYNGDEGVLLYQNIWENGNADYLAIPKDWIIRIRRLKR